MKNRVTVTIPFSFKGKELRPSLEINLDEYNGDNLPSWAYLIAETNAIGNYSYEYEVLESSNLVFSKAEGEAANFLVKNDFDFEGFYQWQQSVKVESKLQEISAEVLGKEAWNEELRKALWQAYEYGAKQNET